MPTLFPTSKEGESYIPVDHAIGSIPSGIVSIDDGGDEIDSVRELNRLLESALRMGGQQQDDGNGNATLDAAAAAAAAIATTPMPFDGGGSHNVESSTLFGAGNSSSSRAAYDTTDQNNNSSSVEQQAASWRLDTARRLSSVSRNVSQWDMCWSLFICPAC